VRDLAVKVTMACVLLAGMAVAKNVFHIGNSLTDETYGMHDVARGKGYTVDLWGRFMIPGASLWCTYDHQDWGVKDLHGTGTAADDVAGLIRNNRWDALVLQVFPANGDNLTETTRCAAGWAGIVYENSPDCQVYLLTSHLSPIDNWSGAAGTVSTLVEPIATAVSAQYPARKPLLVIPVLQVMNRLHDIVLQGSNPVFGSDFASYFQGPEDVHMSPKGLYLAALTCFATIYKCDPRGAADSGLFYWLYSPGGYSVPADYAAAAQQLVWDVVSTYPMGGVGTVRTAPARFAPEARQTSTRVRVVDLRGRNLASTGASSHPPATASGLYIRQDQRSAGVTPTLEEASEY
jgi:hypothetical protein